MKALHKHGVEHTGLVSLRARAASKPTILDVHGVKIGFVAYTDATNGFAAAAPVVAQRLPRQQPEGGREGDHPRRPQGPRRGRRRGHRPAALGHRELPDPQRLAARGGEEAHRREGDHRGRRPGPARRAADRARQRQVRGLQRGQPGLQPGRRRPACRPRPRTGSSPCCTSRRSATAWRCAG